ncbi:MAG TPA: BatA domain-containing protein [Bacteroidia bacterium]|nr:BatA domain-containing protein [Bacteroidia bacterium]
MSFLYPSFLLALTALSIPIIVHLFNFRRYKKLFFTNVRFLKEIQQESRAKSTLKRLLILASRLLALACLVMAFAQPYVPGNHSVKKGLRMLSLYIDNSFSMQSANKNGTLLEDAKRRAREIVLASSASDKFQVLDNDFNGSSRQMQSKEQALDLIDKIQLSPAVKNTEEVYNRMKSNMGSDVKNAELFLLGDFQKSTFNENAFKPDSLLETNFVLLENPAAQNVFIDTCFVESPYFQQGSTQKLHVKIKNLSDKEIENGSLKFYLNNKQVAPVSFKVSPKGITDAILSFTCKEAGIQQGVLAIEDYPVTFDDTLYFSFGVNSRVPCLVINKKETPDIKPGERSATFLQSLFSNDSLFDFKAQNDQNIDYAQFGKTNLIVVNALQNISTGVGQELKKFILTGGSVLIFPAQNADKESYNNFFSQMNAAIFAQADTARTRIENKNLPKDLYEGVFEKKPDNMDMPLINYHYAEQGNSRSGEEILLRLLNGQSFLSLYNKGKGRLYVCSAPLNEKSSSFARHALFVPTLIKIAILSRPAPPLYYFNGENEALDVSLINISGEKPMHINSKQTDFIPEVKTTESNRYVLTHGLPEHAGNYSLVHDKNLLQGLAFNYKRKESDLTCYTKNELEDMAKKPGWHRVHIVEAGARNFKASLADIGGGTRLWKLFVLLTLLFLLAETALIKFMR